MKISKVFFYISIFIFVIAIFLTGSRGALFSAIIFILLIGVKRKLFIGILTVISLLSINLIYVAYDNLPLQWKNRLEFNQDQKDFDWSSGRLDVWNSASTIIKDNLFFGIGLDNFAGYSGFGMKTHNVFLSILVEAGIICFISYFLFITIMLSKIYKHDKYLFLMFFLTQIPIFMTGVWESSPVFWSCLMMTYLGAKLRKFDKQGIQYV